MPKFPIAGDVAPDFTLPTDAGAEITLSSFRGKSSVLIAFFPFAFSPLCTAEMCSFRDDWEKFSTSGCQVIPISVDSRWALQEFKAKHTIPLTLASDYKREVAVQYGVLHPERLFAKRSYVLIDKTGTVRWSYLEDAPGTKRDDAELLAQIAALG